MKTTTHVCRIGIYPKTEEFFRIQGRTDGQIHYTTSQHFLIGSAADADIQVYGKGIAGHHLKITVKDQELCLQNLGSNQKTLVAGNQVSQFELFQYKSGEVIQMGDADLILTVELFSRYLPPQQQVDTLVREAQDNAVKIEEQLAQVKKEMKATMEQTQRECAAMESKARVEADDLITAAQRQIAEKSRQAIGESHAQAEVILQEAKAKADTLMNQAEEKGRVLIDKKEKEAAKVLDRAKMVADELVTSAKNEVDVLLKQAHGKAQVIIHEGENKKKEAQQLVQELQTDMAKLMEQKERLEAETSQCKVTCQEAVQKKQTLLQETQVTENEYRKIRDQFEEFKTEVKRSEEEWQGKLQSFKEKAEKYDEEMSSSQKARDEADKKCEELKSEALQIEKQMTALNQERAQLSSEIKETEEKKVKSLKELEDLNNTYKNELVKLREKVDDEYERQIKKNETYFQELRDKEAMIFQNRQQRLERLEAKRLQHQITRMQERLWQLISDRAVLFGVAGLQENPTFKEDLRDVAAKTMTEEFELRKRELQTTMVKPEFLMFKRRMAARARTYAGWIFFICTLGLLIYGQLNPFLQKLGRDPASVTKPSGAETAPASALDRFIPGLGKSH